MRSEQQFVIIKQRAIPANSRVKVHKLSIEDIFCCKEVPWRKYRNAPEFKEIGVDIAKELEQYFGETAEKCVRGIYTTHTRNMFLNATFGVKEKVEGILDTKDEDDLRKRLDSFQQDFARKKKELTKNNEARYWTYLNNNFGMIAGHMVEEVRKKEGMPDKERSYTNALESMNKIMKCKRDAFLQENPHVSRMNKLQFTQHIFESIHQHQIEELCVSVTGLSQEYELADFCIIPTGSARRVV